MKGRVMNRWSGMYALPVLASLLAGGAITGSTVAHATPSPATGAPAATATAPEPAYARGIIVKTTAGVSMMGLARASEEALAQVDATLPDNAQVHVGPAIATTTRVLLFDQLLPASEAQAAAAVVQARPDVIWAVPDMLRHIAAAPVAAAAPVIPTDPRFSEQWDLWDSSRANGGYSVKAPLVWGTTTGSSNVTVAILDTGITNHPDLNAHVVAGYDFMVDVDMANDGDARDPDPADPGDWVTASEAASGTFQGCDVSDSSWHGTHVAGTIAALQDNGIGISGIAPGVRIQSLRVLGKCGGYDSDIIAAARWAVGGSVPGVPANATPAKVLNLSLGGSGTCPVSYQDVIDFTRSKGAVFVVAAGNESSPVSTSVPANCDGVVSVAATGQDGTMAYYSNYGESAGQITLAAPGGDMEKDTGILSTLNTGTHGPVAPSYDAYQGTSMATPHVVAAAALIYSLGITGTDNVIAKLQQSVQPFPAGTDACNTITCGAGILDLSKLAQSAPPGAPSDLIATQTSSSQISLSWTAPSSQSTILSYDVQQSTDSGSSWSGVMTVTEPSTTITLDAGVTYRFRVAARNSAGVGTWSLPTDDVALSTAMPPGPPTAVHASAGNTTATISWTPPLDTGGSPLAEYVATAQPGGQYCTELTTTCTITGLTNDTAYTITVTASNEAGLTSTPSTGVSVTPTASTTPGKVTNVKVSWTYSPRSATATLRWSAPLDTGGSPVTRYRARLARVGASYGSWISLTQAAVRAPDLRVGRSYRVQIQARNASGWGTSYNVGLRP